MSPISSTLAGASARGYGGLGASVGAALSDFEAIASYTATGSVSDVTFNPIPSTYKILQVRMVVRSALGGSSDSSMFVQFNGDTDPSNYRYNRMYSYSGVNTFGSDFSATATGCYSGITLNDGNVAGDYGGNIFEIIDYANATKTKQVRQVGGSSASQFNSASLWLGTAAIYSMRIFIGNGSIKQHSTVALYGIKG